MSLPLTVTVMWMDCDLATNTISAFVWKNLFTYFWVAQLVRSLHRKGEGRGTLAPIFYFTLHVHYHRLHFDMIHHGTHIVL